MTIKLLISCFGPLAMATSTVAIAGTVTGKVAVLTTRASDGLQIVEIQGTSSNRPACAARFSYFMIRDEKSDTGKTQYAMLMAAFLSGKSVRIDGANTCSRWSDGEDIESVIYVQ
jgi:hypothetical protein